MGLVITGSEYLKSYIGPGGRQTPQMARIAPIGRELLVSLISLLYKYCLLPKGEKIGPRRPNEPLAGHGASGTNFFDRQGLRASLTLTLKNEEPSRASPENALAFYKFSFFLISRRFVFDFYLFHSHP